MAAPTVTLELPEAIYVRLRGAAAAMRRPLEEVLLRALQLGSPPSWDDVPAEFQTELASLDRMDDDALWGLLTQRRSDAELARHDELLARSAEARLSDEERVELGRLRHDHDAFLLRRAHAAALLKWRGHRVSLG